MNLGLGSRGATVVAVLCTLVAGALCVVTPWFGLVLVAGVIVALFASRGLVGYLLAAGLVFTCCASGIKIGGPLTPPDLFLFPAAVCAIGRVIASRRSFVVPMWSLAPPFLILLWNLAASILSRPATLQYLFQYTGFLLLTPFVVGVYADSPRRLRGLMLVFLAGTVVNAALAFVDSVGIWHIASQLTNYGGFRFNHRVPGLTNHPNQLGLLSAMALPVALWLASQRRALGIVAFVVLMAGIFASGSRGGIIGAALSVMLYILFTGRNIARRVLGSVMVLAALAVGAVVAGLTVGINRLLTDPSSATASDDARLERLGYALQQFTDHPITGVGFANLRAHNTYVELARDGGVLTVVLFLFFAVGATRAGWRLRQKYPLVVPIFAAQTTWLVMAVQHNGLFDRWLFVPTGLIVGAATIDARRRARAAAEGPAPSAPVAALPPGRAARAAPARVLVPTARVATASARMSSAGGRAATGRT